MAPPLPSRKNEPPQLRPDQVPALAAVAFNAAGLRFGTDKIDFLRTRLVPRVLDSRAGSFRSYIGLLRQDAGERQAFVEALTVHTTSFFRENSQYDWLRNIGLPALTRHRNNIVLWSAACSTGQEGWSALMAAETYRRQGEKYFTCRLIGTDVSAAVLVQASRAIYGQQDLDGITANYRNAFLLQARDGRGRFRIAPALRRAAEWRWANLATGAGMVGISADVVFLRNVLIYFGSETQAKVIDRVVNGIRPGGYLLTGHSETGFKHPDLTAVQPSIYQKAGKS